MLRNLVYISTCCQPIIMKRNGDDHHVESVCLYFKVINDVRMPSRPYCSTPFYARSVLCMKFHIIFHGLHHFHFLQLTSFFHPSFLLVSESGQNRFSILLFLPTKTKSRIFALSVPSILKRAAGEEGGWVCSKWIKESERENRQPKNERSKW